MKYEVGKNRFFILPTSYLIPRFFNSPTLKFEQSSMLSRGLKSQRLRADLRQPQKPNWPASVLRQHFSQGRKKWRYFLHHARTPLETRFAAGFLFDIYRGQE
jgi:hypothetical protein